jgi:DNA replication protein DnaC
MGESELERLFGKEELAMIDTMNERQLAAVRARETLHLVENDMKQQVPALYRGFDSELVAQREELDKWLVIDVGSLVISGGIGTGKSFAMAYLYQRMLEKHAVEAKDVYDVAGTQSWHFFPTLVDKVVKGEKIRLTKVMFLDDIARQYNSDWSMQRLDTLVEEIYTNSVRCVMTSNLSSAMVRNLPGLERVMDRLLPSAHEIFIMGASRRGENG